MCSTTVSSKSILTDILWIATRSDSLIIHYLTENFNLAGRNADVAVTDSQNEDVGGVCNEMTMDISQ